MLVCISFLRGSSTFYLIYCVELYQLLLMKRLYITTSYQHQTKHLPVLQQHEKDMSHLEPPASCKVLVTPATHRKGQTHGCSPAAASCHDKN